LLNPQTYRLSMANQVCDNQDLIRQVLSGQTVTDDSTYYYPRDACFSNRRFPVEMMHMLAQYVRIKLKHFKEPGN